VDRVCGFNISVTGSVTHIPRLAEPCYASKAAISMDQTEPLEPEQGQVPDTDQPTPANETEVQTSPGTKATTRPRSTSIPSTPSIAHVNVETVRPTFFSLRRTDMN
jgi:hypothetical protein